MTMPVTLMPDPIIMAAQAAAVVPFFQYKPPIITAPEPPTKIAPVMAKNSRMY